MTALLWKMAACMMLTYFHQCNANVYNQHLYPKGSLSCKLFDSSSLDCSQRNLSAIPPLSTTYPNITSVDLQGNHIEYLAPSSFSNQRELFYLDLSINRLHNTTGSPFLELVTLGQLRIANNKLVTMGEMTFKGLYNLLTLDLSNNMLKDLPNDIFSDLSNLLELNLSTNYLQIIPSQAVAPLHSLRKLDLIWNYFTLFKLGDGFKNLLHLSNLLLWSIAPINNTVIANNTFSNLVNAPLQNLHFQFEPGNNITVETGLFTPLGSLNSLGYANTFEPLPSLDSNLQRLQIIFWENLTETSLQPLSKFSTTLNELTIQIVADGIYSPVFKWFPALQVLDLSNVYYALRHLSPDAFFGLDNLQQLYLVNNRLTDIPSESLRVFAASESLLKIDLSYNTLDGFFSDRAFASVTSLTHLYLSHNPIYNVGNWINILTNLIILNLDYNTGSKDIISIRWTTPLLSLRQVTLSYPAHKDILRFGGFYFSKQAPNLQVLMMAEAYIYHISTIQNLPHLQSLFVSGSFVQMNNFNTEWNKVYFPNMEVLDLSSNKLESVTTIRFNDTTPILRQLVLSNNFIQVIQKDVFGSLTSLQYLNMEDNKLQSLNAFTNLNSIQTLLLSGNGITEVPEEFLAVISSNSSTLITLDLSGNPFACVCHVRYFRDWILSDVSILLLPNLMYQCKSPKENVGLSITQVDIDCTNHQLRNLLIGISCGIVVCLVAIAVVRYRWHIKYKMFVVCNWRREHQLIEEDINANINRLKYDAFVSYAHESIRDLEWVLDELRPNLEEGPEPLKLCIGHARDFIPGTALLEAITEGIQESYKTILVLSPEYLDSEWCYFETQQAWMQLLNEGHDVLILVLLEPIPDDKMTMWLRQFLCKKDYLKWPTDKYGQKLFWNCLREHIKTRSLINRRYDA